MVKINDLERIIFSRTKVVFLKGYPGSGKSSIFKEIAEKNNLMFIDIRTAQIDSTEIIGKPNTTKYGDVSVMGYDIPEWAYLANNAVAMGYKGALIFFDELNRSIIEVRNATLQVLLDRAIGYKFKFNDNVYFASAGNLGEEDGTEVDEFENALRDRLATIKHQLSVTEWLTNFGRRNVNSYICSFLEVHPMYFYKINDKEDNITTPRGWSQLSTVIGKDEKDIEKILDAVETIGVYYVGSSISKFMTYLRDLTAININDILNRYEQVKDVLAKTNRDRVKELLHEMEKKEFDKLNKTQTENLSEFIKTIDEDSRIGFFQKLLDKYVDRNSDPAKPTVCANMKSFYKIFKDDFQFIFNAEVRKNELKK